MRPHRSRTLFVRLQRTVGPTPSVQRFTEVLSVIRSARRTLPVAVLILAACNVPVSQDRVPGTYVMNRGRAADTLMIRANHSYERRYSLPGSTTHVDRGTWSFDSLRAERYITFDSFPPRWHAETRPRSWQDSRGFWPVMPERTITGGIVLGVDPDLDWEYRKVSVAF